MKGRIRGKRKSGEKIVKKGGGRQDFKCGIDYGDKTNMIFNLIFD